MKNNNSIKIKWLDAFLYTDGEIPHSISKMITTGFVYKETKEFFIIEKPTTINTRTKKRHPLNFKPKYYYIPKGMIVSVEKVKGKV